MEGKSFNIIYLEKAIFFINKQSSEVQSAIYTTIDEAKKRMDKKLLKKLVGTNIWEFRTKYNGIEYRLLAFWDKKKKSFVVATNGFIKKSQKTPQKEIEKAERIRKQYYEQ
ncbi:MAG: type II toxin-antitoxin system RelE/ParE family toxin [Bacteroidales bacterium]|nr:type II toxin-antitoxin system RelE/ParE family toxin [Bacteroidales bacterium]MBQ9311606.1 type II toxin-antitoxin system RelE/ParE family toxin [Bacteroidales bacterium]